MKRFLNRIVRSPMILILGLMVLALPLALAQSSSGGQDGSSSGGSTKKSSNGSTSIVNSCHGRSVSHANQSGSIGPASGGKCGSVGQSSYTIKAKDYTFSPDRMTWKVGEKITLTVINTSPDDLHMFMMGKDPHYTKSKFGKPFPKGWNKPLFTKPGQVTFHHAVDVMTQNPKPGGTLQEGGFELAKAGDKNPKPQATISFTVPNKPGTWHYACFEQHGQHYSAHHMVGTITIKK